MASDNDIKHWHQTMASNIEILSETCKDVSPFEKEIHSTHLRVRVIQVECLYSLEELNLRPP